MNDDAYGVGLESNEWEGRCDAITEPEPERDGEM